MNKSLVRVFSVIFMVSLFFSFPLVSPAMASPVPVTFSPVYSTGNSCPPLRTGTSVEPARAYTEEDVQLLAMCIYKEYGYSDTPDYVQRLVGQVVMNRVHSKYYGDTIYDVLNSPGQYQFAMTGDYSIQNAEAFCKARRNAIYVLSLQQEEYDLPPDVVYQSEYPNLGSAYLQYTSHGTTTYFSCKE